jgi:hypothetical protein
MDGDRRAAPRHLVPEGVTATVSGVPVKLLELSLVGAKVEHRERFTLTAPQLTIRWHGKAMAVPVRAARSQIVGRSDADLIYLTGLSFLEADEAAREVLASILEDPASPEMPPAAAPPPPAMDDTFTRKVQLLRNGLDDDHLPYAQFRLTAQGWEKDYSDDPAQPEDGFTIERERHDFDELQRAFEAADPDTRRMMQVALESQLTKRGTS